MLTASDRLKSNKWDLHGQHQAHDEECCVCCNTNRNTKSEIQKKISNVQKTNRDSSITGGKRVVLRPERGGNSF